MVEVGRGSCDGKEVEGEGYLALIQYCDGCFSLRLPNFDTTKIKCTH